MENEKKIYKLYKTNKEEQKALLKTMPSAAADQSQHTDARKIAYCLIHALHLVYRKDDSNKLVFMRPVPGEDYLYNDIDIDDIKYFASVCADVTPIRSKLASIAQDIYDNLVAFARKEIIDMTAYAKPPRNFIMMQGGVFDTIKDEYVENAEKDYHFTLRSDHLKRDKFNSTYFAEIDSIFDVWSDHDDEVKQMIIDMIRCILEGNNKQKIFVLTGPGGNGKSSLIEICTRLIHKSEVARLDLNKFNKDFHLDTLHDDLRLVQGAELKSNFRLGDDALMKLKQFAMNETFDIDVKHGHSRSITSYACYIQASNTLMTVSESNAAVKARFVFLPWTKKDFRQAQLKGEDLIDLEKLISKDEFINQVFNYVMSHSKHFRRFHIPESVVQKTNEQIDDSSNLVSYCDYLTDMNIIGTYSKIPTHLVYEGYKAWLNQENSASKPMSKRMFIARFAEILESRNYVIDRDNSGKARQINVKYSLNKLEYDSSSFDFMHEDVEKFLSKNRNSTLFVNKNLEIDYAKVNKVLKDVEANVDVDLSDIQNVIILKHLIYDRNHTLATSIYKQEIDKLL